jgi:hypothetical protein
MSDATRERFIATIERSQPEEKLDEKIRAANARHEAHEHTDPWARFRASLSMARGSRTIGIG